MKKFLKLILSVYYKIKLLIGKINVDMYYLITGKFYHEHKVVFNAIISHKKINKDSLALSARLRRNIHRIEKGLTMPKLKDIFAESYIYQTVNDLKLFNEVYPDNISTIKWAKDIFELYFSMVKKTTEIQKALLVFNNFGRGTFLGHELSFDIFIGLVADDFRRSSV